MGFLKVDFFGEGGSENSWLDGLEHFLAHFGNKTKTDRKTGPKKVIHGARKITQQNHES